MIIRGCWISDELWLNDMSVKYHSKHLRDFCLFVSLHLAAQISWLNWGVLHFGEIDLVNLRGGSRGFVPRKHR